MCGRFALSADRARILPALPLAHPPDWVDEHLFVPRFNIAPRTFAPVLRRNHHQALILHSMNWGLVPHWSKAEHRALSTTNARAENLVEGGGMWAPIKGKNRCAVICQGYYEWLTKGREKLPHFVKYKDGQLMFMAGLYAHAVIDGQSLWTFSIVTTDACPSFSWLHDRQPVILSTQEALDAWLDPSTQTWTPALTNLVQPYSNEVQRPLECYQVPKEVGKVGNESPSFIEPVKDRKDGIQAMFQKQAKAAEKRKRSDSLPEDKEEKKPKTEPASTPPPSPRKRASKASSPQKPSPVSEKGKITAFFRKT